MPHIRMRDLLQRAADGLLRALRFVLVDIPLGVLYLAGIVLSLIVEAAAVLHVLVVLLLIVFLLSQCPA